MACGKCREGGGKCVFGDDAANALAEKMAAVDAVVVGSPVYYEQPNGALFALLKLRLGLWQARRDGRHLPARRRLGGLPVPQPPVPDAQLQRRRVAALEHRLRA